MNPFNPTGRCAALLLILLTTVGCAATKRSAESSAHRQSARLQTLERRLADSLTSSRESLLQRLDSSTFLRIISRETIPGERVQLTIPIHEMERLPPGAIFRSRSGRTSIEARMEGDTLILTGESDTIARDRRLIEQRTARRQLEAEGDRALRRISADERLQQQDSTLVQTEAEARVFRKRSSVRWLIGGLAVGAILLLLSRAPLSRLLTKAIQKLW